MPSRHRATGLTLRRFRRTGFVACCSLAASALTFGWLIKSSSHADRPPLYAIIVFLFALGAAVVGLGLGVRTVRLLRDARNAQARP